MLTHVDRIQLAVPDRAAAAAGWVGILGAEHARDDRIDGLAARRSRYRLGTGWVELLEPDGAGPVADAVAHRRGHLFAAGVSTPDVDALAARLRARGLAPLVEHGQIHLTAADTGGHGLRIVVSRDAPHAPVGRIDAFYEVTNLAADTAPAVARLVELFDLDPRVFVPIESKEYGYDGTLTLFDRERLDRLEVITPRDLTKTMGRFFARQGASLYMVFAETGCLGEIEAAARAGGVPHTAVPPAGARDARGPHTVFLHPPALGGAMLGLSRRDYAWTWSGHPERAR